jgi:spore germination protein
MTRPSAGRWDRNTWLLGVAAIATLSVALASLAWGLFPFSQERLGRDGSPSAAVEPKRIGYVPYWDQRRGFEVVRQNPDLFDEVSPVWYSLEPTGDIVLTDAEHTTVDRRTVQFLQQSGVRVIPTVTNLRDGEWEPELVRQMLHDPAATRTHIQELVELAADEGYDGIDIDYEHLRGEDRQPFSNFLEELGEALRAEGRVLTVAVHAKTSDKGYDERNLAQDYRAIGEAADQVRVMTYDYSWEASTPGPVAPLGWVEEVIAWTVTQIPPEKVILGIVLLGYEWADGLGTTVEFEQVQQTAQEHGVTVQRSGDRSPWFRYQDPSGTTHEVWYEDADSVQVKLGLVSRYGLGGAFFWRLGGEDPRVWSVLRDKL